MTTLSIQPPFPILTDADGQPLENGYIWIGTANLNPQTSPITVYWDAALTQTAVQPIRTRGGYPVNAGTPARLYVGSDYSILVQNKNGLMVYSAPAATERYSDPVITGVSSAEVSFLQAGLGAVVRTAQSKMRDVVSVKDFGAVGDGVTDDTAAIQAAASHAAAIRGELVFPPAGAGQFYKITAPIIFSSAVSICGESTRGVLVYAVGMSAGQYMFDFDCLAVNVVEHVRISGLTLRSDNGSPSGLRLKNVAYVDVRSVRFYGLFNGVVLEGTRCFTHLFQDVDGYLITGSTVRWTAGFTGGGQFTFNNCTFTGATGVFLPSTCVTDSLTFLGCNWEQCTSFGLMLNGTCAAFAVFGGRTEGGDVQDFIIRPVLAPEYVGGISISGVSFSASDNSAAARIRIGGDAGTVRGFSVLGNIVTHGTDSFAGSLVEYNGDGTSGIVAGNYLRGTTCTVVSARAIGVKVFGNENMAGMLPEYDDTPLTTIVYSASMTPNAGNGDVHIITANNNTAFTINAPTNPPPAGRTQRLTLTIRNTSGGALGTVTWNSIYKLAAWTSPATGNSRSISFDWDGANWVEKSRSTADVPN